MSAARLRKILDLVTGMAEREIRQGDPTADESLALARRVGEALAAVERGEGREDVALIELALSEPVLEAGWLAEAHAPREWRGR